MSVGFADTLQVVSAFKDCEFLGEKGKRFITSLKMNEMRCEQLDVKINKVVQQMQENNVRLNDQLKLLMIGGNNNSSADETALEEKVAKLVSTKAEEMEKENIQLKADVSKLIRDIEQKVQGKASLAEITSLDNHLSKTIDQVIVTFSKKFLEKKEFRRYLNEKAAS